MTTPKASLVDLPPELLDHIVSYLPTTSNVASLGRTTKALHTFVEKDAYQTFCRTRFPSLHPASSPCWKDTGRTLATLSRAWDRRAFVARYVEPGGGDIVSWPQGKKVERWQRARGQTIGFTPQLDVHEKIGSKWSGRTEILTFSAGAEVCIRTKETGDGKSALSWNTYRPLSAVEGRDDVTALHLLRTTHAASDGQAHRFITGTANGDLQMVDLPESKSAEIRKIYFVTEGRPVRSSSILRGSGEGASDSMMAVNLGDSHMVLYSLTSDKHKVAPLTELDLRPAPVNGHTIKGHKAWSTQFLSPSRLAVGIGPNDEPIRIFSITPSGLDNEPVRQFSLQPDISDRTDEIAAGGVAKKPTSSVYPIVPLPTSSIAASGQEGNVFLSGGYDGLVRLHDLRSRQDVELEYVDPTDDSAIYSMLPRGQEKLVVGTARHSLLKVFDLRLGGRCYDYLDASTSTMSKDSSSAATSSSSANGFHVGCGTFQSSSSNISTKDYSMFLRPPSTTNTFGRGWAAPRRGNAESSVYNLVSPSHHSPYIYAGVENAVVELAFTGVLDHHPDPVFFESMFEAQGMAGRDTYKAKEVLDLAMYEQDASMKLCSQRSLWETWRCKDQPLSGGGIEGLDERWRIGT